MTDESRNSPDDERGAFPFPLSPTGESKYLVWLRNHSNYMAVHGLQDYLRAIGVLVRGVVVNFLIFLPSLLIVALAVAAYHMRPAGLWLVDSPFGLTLIVLGLTLLWFLISAVLAPLFRIGRHKRVIATGSDSSVNLRNKLERSFGAFLLIAITVAALEGVAFLLPWFHQLAFERGFGWVVFASIAGVALAAVSSASWLVSVLGGAARMLALGLVGLLGVLIPLLVVMFVSDFIVFGHPGDLTLPLVAAVWVLPVVALLVLFLGLWAKAFRARELMILIGLFIASGGVVVFVSGADTVALEQLGEVDAALGQVADALLDREEPLRQVIADVVAGGEARWVERATELRRLQRDVEVLADSLLIDSLALPAGVAERMRRLADRAARLPLSVPEGTSADVIVRTLVSVRSTTLDSLRAAADSIDVEVYGSSFVGGSALPWGTEFPSLDRGLDLLTDLELGIRQVRWRLAAAVSYSPSLYPALYDTPEAERVRDAAFLLKVIFVLMAGGLLALLSWLSVDVNLTSIHGLYRDRLASAFLIRDDGEGGVEIEADVDLDGLCRHSAGSVAPYHLINGALNLQGSKDVGVRDRKSDFFVFSKKFIGGERTGYCRSSSMEHVFPQMDLATAMAISAAAASPNMGRGTNPALVAIMALLNVRLGFWLPNPGLVETRLATRAKGLGKAGGFSFGDVFGEELDEVEHRWCELPDSGQRRLDRKHASGPTTAHGLVGIAYSGGGIRSATLNLGITQALHRRGVFDHVDYMSTVSGGGYLGSSISTLMREQIRTNSEIAGTVRVERSATETVVSVTGRDESRSYRYKPHAPVAVSDGEQVRIGQRLVAGTASEDMPTASFGQAFYWRVRPRALLNEVLGKLDEKGRSVNVSDGGHIENLGVIELLRRRCKYIIVGDGETDPHHRFRGLATLIRLARIDLSVQIDIEPDRLRLAKGLTKAHWAFGRITYPGDPEPGYLLYLKASLTGNEDAVIREYRHRNPGFPHQSSADQFFGEGQFEAYRSLGQHIGEAALEHVGAGEADRDEQKDVSKVSWSEFKAWFAALDAVSRRSGDEGGAPRGQRIDATQPPL